jgi:ElaB/YqjD/DUF883 family membrane-anchored ribosome-binding protein
MSDTIGGKASETYNAAKAKAAKAAETAKAKANKAASSAKTTASKAKVKSTQTLESNPLAVLAGGLAIGAIVAALIPRTQREDKLVGKVGKTVRATASKAAKTATSTAKEQLNELGLNADAAKGQLRDIVSKISEAASSAGSAAADTVRKRK